MKRRALLPLCLLGAFIFNEVDIWILKMRSHRQDLDIIHLYTNLIRTEKQLGDAMEVVSFLQTNQTTSIILQVTVPEISAPFPNPKPIPSRDTSL